MNRYVEDVPAFTRDTSGSFALIGQGVTHYQTAWIDGMTTDSIIADLFAAGLPDTMQVTYDPERNVVDIALLLDDQGHWAGTIQSVGSLHVTG